MVSPPYKLQLNPNPHNYLYIFYASKQLAPFEYCATDIQKLFTLQKNFLGPSVFVLHTVVSNPSFQPLNKRRVDQETYKRFRKKLLPRFAKNFIFKYRKFTSPLSLFLIKILKNAYTIGWL